MQKKHLILGFALVFIISGCIGLVPGGDTKAASSLYKGTKGIEMSFVNNAPPKRVFGDTPFNVIVRVENKGAYDVGFEKEKGIFVITPESGYVDFKSIDESDGVEYNGQEKSSSFSVRGRSLSNPVGEEIVVNSYLGARELSSLSNIHESSVFATACYPYQTKLSTTVCIDPDFYNLAGVEKACEVKDLLFLTGQGAPVAITKIEVKIAPAEDNLVKPEFIVHVQNKGIGEVVKKDSYMSACGARGGKPNEENKYFNVIMINKDETKLSNNVVLDCKQGGDQEIVLSGKEGVFRCETLEGITVDRAYLTPLSIVLDYGYTSTISKGFNIESS